MNSCWGDLFQHELFNCPTLGPAPLDGRGLLAELSLRVTVVLTTLTNPLQLCRGELDRVLAAELSVSSLGSNPLQQVMPGVLVRGVEAFSILTRMDHFFKHGRATFSNTSPPFLKTRFS